MEIQFTEYSEVITLEIANYNKSLETKEYLTKYHSSYNVYFEPYTLDEWLYSSGLDSIDDDFNGVKATFKAGDRIALIDCLDGDSFGIVGEIEFKDNTECFGMDYSPSFIFQDEAISFSGEFSNLDESNINKINTKLGTNYKAIFTEI